MAKLFSAHRPKTAPCGVRPTTKDAGKPAAPVQDVQATRSQATDRLKEVGGPSGPEPTRYGDWERKGICVDF